MGDIEAYRYSNAWHPCTHIATCTPSLELGFSISLGFPGSGPRHGNPEVPWPVRRNSSPLQPKWKRITKAQVQPKSKNNNDTENDTETPRATTKHQTTCYMLLVDANSLSHIQMVGCTCANGKPNCFATSLAHNLSSWKTESRWYRTELSKQNMYKCMCE